MLNNRSEYLLTDVAEPGQGGDKQNFWQNILGSDSADAIREAISMPQSGDMDISITIAPSHLKCSTSGTGVVMRAC